MYNSVFCLMVVSIMKSVPYVLKAIPIVRLSHELICNSILNCLSVLSQGNFVIRAIIADNHRTNLSAFQHLYKAYPITGKPNCISNPHRSSQHIFIMIDTVHLYIKSAIVVCVCVCPELIGKTTSPRKLKICIKG